MNILDIGRSHFTGIRSNHIGVIEVPEWKDENGEVVKIYVRPFTLAEQSERETRAIKDDYLGFNISTLIFSACNEDMKPMFHDSPTVRNILQKEFCPKVLTRIISKISEIQNQDSSADLGDLEQEKKS